MTFPNETRLVARLAALGVAALSILTLAAPVSAKPPKRTHGALIRVSTAKLRSGPGEHHKATALLDEGRSARVVARVGKWAKVRLDSGRTGWVRRDLLDVAKKATRDPDAGREESTPRRRRKRSHDEDEAPTRRVAHKSSKKSAPAPKVARKSEPDRHSTGRPVERPTVAAHVAPAKPRPVAPARTAALVEVKKPGVNGETERSAEADTEEKTTLPVRGDDDPETDAPKDNISKARQDLVGGAMDLLEPARGELISRAKDLRGTPYRFGSTGGGSFDCSGFTQHIYKRQGIYIPRTAAEQFGRGASVARPSLQPGDLVFFRNTAGRAGISHVGMYVGDGDFIHASSHGGVRIDSLSKDYYQNHYAGARRILK